ncbi:ATP-binding cassette domain-containing protein [Halosimplex halophilum]|uniref:ATP-binding cassette domain-containing protein n=1 Tax=Halosimplex halophilum TaxID=2559572 RepID=UPI00107F93E3|nr:ATP-binding cassette domain-containing protein [Halosimplex halophilum]
MTLLEATDLETVYGDPCGECVARTGDEAGTNQCPVCGAVVACADVSLDVEPGEVLGIVGESGSGKSSVAELLALERNADGHTGGDVRLRGHDGNLLAADYETRHRLRTGEIGLVHQHIRDGLNLAFTGGGNVAEKLLAAGERSFGDVRERVRELYEATEVPVDRMDDPAETYSGGMQRRVQIARALATDPEVVVLDEPTTGLDVSVQARVLDMFRRIQREADVAAVVVSHDLGVVRLLADRTLVMRHGRVVERGLTDRVMEDPHHEYTQTLINSVI